MPSIQPKDSITHHPTGGGGHPNESRPPLPGGGRPAFVPPPVTINPKPEGLDRRIRNLEAQGSQVFIGNVLASYMALPGLVGFWPMSSVQRTTGNAYDLSGQGRTLTYNGNPAYTYYNGLVPYIDLDGTGDFLSRANEADMSLTGAELIFTTGAAGITMGGWFWLDAAAATSGMMGKWTDTGNQRGYLLYHDGGGAAVNIYGAFSNDGTAIDSQVNVAASLGTWLFAAIRYIGSTSVTTWVNATSASDTSSIPSSVFNNTAAFQIGAYNAGTSLVNGRAALCFLCANGLGDDLVSSLFQTSRVIFGV